MNEPVVLRHRLGALKQGREMQLDRLADVALGVLDGGAIAEAAGQGGAVGQLTLVLRLLFDDDLKRIEFHHPSSSGFILHPPRAASA